ncbi:MAG: DUF1553 domain-containing protein [Acidobacteriota bacterium]
MKRISPLPSWLGFFLSISFTVPQLQAQIAPDLVEITFEPSFISIYGIGESQRVLVTGRFRDGSLCDLSRTARLSTANPEVAQVEPESRLVVARSEGVTELIAETGGRQASAQVRIVPWDKAENLSFTTDVAPVFSRLGCNAGGCHGALNGQGGFKLSLFGYQPEADYKAIVEEGRVNLEQPEQSLILMKPTFTVPHGGGVRFQKDSLEYRALHEWIQAGAPRGKDDGLRLEELKVYPQGQRFLQSEGARQQLVVIGRYSDGREVDMTRQVEYTPSDDTVVEVTPEGLVSALRDGESSVMIRSLGAVDVAQLAVVTRPPLDTPYPLAASHNFIDELVFDKLEKLRMVPSELCTDSEFIRRVYLDLIGTLPTAEETRGFLEDASPDKRERLIDALFARPDYADFWALKWGDLLTNSPQFLFNGTAYFQAWLRKSFKENIPYDELVRQLLTAGGGTYQALPTNYYAVGKKPEDMATFTSQAFMGVSIECARCHDHPNAKWKREDFLGLAAFFSQVKFKGGFRNNERFLYIEPSKEFEHPESKDKVAPRFLGGELVQVTPGEDRRAILADWLVSSSNPYFAKAAVNRIWSEFMGRGIVDPVDDFRTTNPPSHPELLERLSADFIVSGFDLQHLMKRILSSRAYQSSSRTNETNREDETAYSHYMLRRLTAEQLADAIAQVTGVPEKYPFFYPGKRAIQLPDPIVDSYLLTIFDRATREKATCTRTPTASLAQSLHLISGEVINARLTEESGKLAQLIAAGKSNEQIVEHFCLRALSRLPTAGEIELARKSIEKSRNRHEGLEDFVWALLNSKEFLYNH